MMVIFTFPNTHNAIRAERAVKKAGIKLRMTPVPRHISTDCNVGLNVSEHDKSRCVQILEHAGIPHRCVSP